MERIVGILPAYPPGGLRYCQRIALELVKSPYAVAEIEGILRFEVYPACHQNLVRLAGEWGGFDESLLLERVCPFFGQRLRRRFPQLHGWMFKRHWKRVQAVVIKTRARGLRDS